jgi:hypothetical protein
VSDDDPDDVVTGNEPTQHRVQAFDTAALPADSLALRTHAKEISNTNDPGRLRHPHLQSVSNSCIVEDEGWPLAVTRSQQDAVPMRDAYDRPPLNLAVPLATRIRQRAGLMAWSTGLAAAAHEILDKHGYDRVEEHRLTLINCPFHALAQDCTDLVCGMNLDRFAASSPPSTAPADRDPAANTRPLLVQSTPACRAHDGNRRIIFGALVNSDQFPARHRPRGTQGQCGSASWLDKAAKPKRSAKRARTGRKGTGRKGMKQPCLKSSASSESQSRWRPTCHRYSTSGTNIALQE